MRFLDWILRTLNRFRASRTERRLHRETAALKREIRHLEGRLAEAEAAAAARSAEVELFQEAHAKAVAVLQAETAEAHARVARAEKGQTR